MPSIGLHGSALSLTERQALPSEVAGKYNTGQGDIQAKLLWLQGKDPPEGPGGTAIVTIK
jgi:hypothetical protein